MGGTHPALVEALGHRNAVLAHDVPEHHEVLDDAGVYFAYRDPDSLALRLRELLDAPDRIAHYRSAAEQRVRDHYTWDAVTDAYETWFRDMVVP